MLFNKAREVVGRHMEAGLVDFVRSMPGIGKTALAYLIAEEFNLCPVVIYMSGKLPEEIAGAPEPYDATDHKGNSIRKLRYLQYDNIPSTDWVIPKGYDGWLMVLDEVTSVEREVQPALFRLVYERYFGDTALHPDCSMILLGNLSTDEGIVNPISTPMLSRLCHIHLEVDPPVWTANAVLEGIDSRIIRWIMAKPEMLCVFDPAELHEVTNPTFACPRTMYMLSSAIMLPNDVPRLLDFTEDIEELTGIIGSAPAANFLTFLALAGQLRSKAEYIHNPSLMNHIQDIELQMYAAVVFGEWLATATSSKEVSGLSMCVEKLPESLKVVTLRTSDQLRGDNSSDVLYNSSPEYSRVFSQVIALYS